MIDLATLEARAKHQCECTGQCGAHQPRPMPICICGHAEHWHVGKRHECTFCMADSERCRSFQLDHVAERVWRCRDGTRRKDKTTGERIRLEPLELAGGDMILACPSCRARHASGYVAPKPPAPAESPQIDLLEGAARGQAQK